MLSRGDGLSLAPQKCTLCLGLGRRSGRGKTGERVCGCVYRAVFRRCLWKFQGWADALGRADRVRASAAYGFIRSEFVADFVLIAQRELSEEQYRLFKFHFLLGADWKLCCRKLGTERGAFFHEVYRIEELLGRVFCTLEPHALYPIDAYVAGIRHSEPHPLLRLDHEEEEEALPEPLPAPFRKRRRAAA